MDCAVEFEVEQLGEDRHWTPAVEVGTGQMLICEDWVKLLGLKEGAYRAILSDRKPATPAIRLEIENILGPEPDSGYEMCVYLPDETEVERVVEDTHYRLDRHLQDFWDAGIFTVWAVITPRRARSLPEGFAGHHSTPTSGGTVRPTTGL